MTKKLNKATLAIIETSGKRYMGEYADGKVTNAMAINNLSNEAIATYIKCRNTKKLRNITLANGADCHVEELTEMELLQVEHLERTFELAKTQAMPIVENQAFDVLLGK